MMNIKNSLPIAAILLLFTACSIASDNYADKPTEDAAGLVTDYVTSDDQDKHSVIGKMEKVLDENPENINVKNMYANLLIADKQYEKGLKELEEVNNRKKVPVSTLVECMLREKLEKEFMVCYVEAVTLSEKHNKDDLNFLASLFLAHDKRFAAEKSRLLKEGKVNEEQTSIFSQPRNKLIEEILP